MSDFDIVIVGAGWSGLYAARYAAKHGLRYIVLEGRDDLGGVWNFTEDRSIVTTMKTTVSSSSTTMTEASDFPMPEEYGHFFHHTEALSYLRDYADNFAITPLIRFGCRVVETRKQDDGWTIVHDTTSADGSVERRETKARFLAVCTGNNGRKRPATGPIAAFEGNLVHAGDIKSFDDWSLTANDHVIVYGGGETASDIVDELVNSPAEITWAIRDGQHFYRRTAVDARLPTGVFDKHTPALDLNSTTIFRALSYYPDRQPGIRCLTNYLCTGSPFGIQGHGIPQWVNDVPTGHAFFNKGGHSVEFVRSGRVAAEGAIEKVDGHTVEFASGNTAKATTIIYCFGYMPDFPFLPEDYRPLDLSGLLHLCIHPRDPSLLFLGFARPTWFSIPFMTELQCGYAFKVLSGKLPLPDRKTRIEMADAFRQERRKQFPGPRLKTLVDPMQYYERFVSLEGNPVCTPARLLRSPVQFARLLSAPLIPRFSHYRDHPVDDVLKTMTTPVVGRPLRFLDWHNIPFYLFAALVVIPIFRFTRMDDLADWLARKLMARGAMPGFKGGKPRLQNRDFGSQPRRSEA